jgi:hypothetical protein
MAEAQKGKSFGGIQRFINALSYVYRFFLVPDIVTDTTVYEVKRFLAKVCPHVRNKKHAFGSAEVRNLWDAIDAKGGIRNLSQAELRTFVMCIVQHATFCRFNDLQHVKLGDIVFDLDYFKIKIAYSKTDQNGIGQSVFIPSIGYHQRNPHLLMCLYLHSLPDNDVNMYLFPPHK